MTGDFQRKALRYCSAAVAGLIMVGGLVMVYPTYRRGQALKVQEAELMALIEKKKAEIAKLRECQQRFRTDSDFVELIARQNHRVFPGELVFIFDD